MAERPCVDTGGSAPWQGADTLPDPRGMHEQLTAERLRAGAFTRWQDAHKGKAIAGTVLVKQRATNHRGREQDIGLAPLPKAVDPMTDGRLYVPGLAPSADDRRAPKVQAPFAKTVRKCEPAGPLRTSTGFRTTL